MSSARKKLLAHFADLSVGGRLRALRELTGLSIRESAWLGNVAPRSLAGWERGERMPRADVYLACVTRYLKLVGDPDGR